LRSRRHRGAAGEAEIGAACPCFGAPPVPRSRLGAVLPAPRRPLGVLRRAARARPGRVPRLACPGRSGTLGRPRGGPPRPRRPGSFPSQGRALAARPSGASSRRGPWRALPRREHSARASENGLERSATRYQSEPDLWVHSRGMVSLHGRSAVIRRMVPPSSPMIAPACLGVTSSLSWRSIAPPSLCSSSPASAATARLRQCLRLGAAPGVPLPLPRGTPCCGGAAASRCPGREEVLAPHPPGA